MIQIKNRFDDSIIIYESEHKTLRDAVISAIADQQSLSYADLSDTNLSDADLSYADLSYADLSDTDLSYADLSDTNLSGADLSGADLSGADLSGANLSGANLSGANLSYATMDGLPNVEPPQSLIEAALRTKDWLANERWVQESWIQTPTGAYAGDCKACLHGAAVYVGGPFGKELSQKLIRSGYTVEWNDTAGRTIAEVCEVLDAVAAV